MKNLKGAMEEEKKYVADRLSDIKTNLIDRLSQYGYSDLNDYYTDKRDYLFAEWKPEVYRIDGEYLATKMEKAIVDGQYGIYIMTTNNTYAFHGNDPMDYKLCEDLSVEAIELGYSGGTIIGDAQDLGILLVMPREFNITPMMISQKVLSIIGEFIDNAEISGNDILVDGKKVMGSMNRRVGNSFVWAAQISFADHDELITKICNKTSAKKPSYIDRTKLSRNETERRLLKWLQKH